MICKSPLKDHGTYHGGSKCCLAGFTDDLLNLFELAWPKGKKAINRALTVVSYGAIRYQYKLKVPANVRLCPHLSWQCACI